MIHRASIVRTSLACALGLALGLAFHGFAFAQYKWVNADGTIGYGDRPPSDQVKMLKTPSGAVKAAPEDDGSGLPYALQQASTRYPVVLYTGTPATGECTPCKDGREYLSKRGIPFSEKIVKSNDDIKHYKENLSAEGTLPVMTVGKEKAVGYEVNAWSNMLDAAGYPKSSILPKGYKQAAAAPMSKAAESAKNAKPESKAESRSAKANAAADVTMIDPNATSKIRF